MSDEEVPAEEIAEEEVEEVAEMNVLDALKEVRSILLFEGDVVWFNSIMMCPDILSSFLSFEQYLIN